MELQNFNIINSDRKGRKGRKGSKVHYVSGDNINIIRFCHSEIRNSDNWDLLFEVDETKIDEPSFIKWFSFVKELGFDITYNGIVKTNYIIIYSSLKKDCYSVTFNAVDNNNLLVPLILRMVSMADIPELLLVADATLTIINLFPDIDKFKALYYAHFIISHCSTGNRYYYLDHSLVENSSICNELSIVLNKLKDGNNIWSSCSKERLGEYSIFHNIYLENKGDLKNYILSIKNKYDESLSC